MLAAGKESELRCWSAGCAGGEEPYTVAIIWHECLAMRFPTLRLRIVATDIDAQAIKRAERGCYRASSLKQLPREWFPSGGPACPPGRHSFALRRSSQQRLQGRPPLKSAVIIQHLNVGVMPSFSQSALG
jgi:chemotaxis methyl-accepting protein methylase